VSDGLFEAAPGPAGPLADRMRPRTLDEFVGQEHIVGPGRLLRRAIQRDRLSSIILAGPPGSGKTTLARIIANTTKSRFLSLNAVLSGVQAIRDAIESARRERELYDRRTILFVDEVHRWNKAQQDALLPWVENGTFILVGATTQNPYFEVNSALVSRSRVFQLTALTDEDLRKAADAALSDRERGYGAWTVDFEAGALEHLVRTAAGDARSLLNALELAVETSVDPWPPEPGTRLSVSIAAAEESIQRRAVLYDRDGDCHYDAASALIKSLRGSDPDAALYWAARMVYAGEDPRFVFRRLLISAAEDVGLADPAAVGVVASCAAAYDRVGLPEGQYHMTEAILYLATAPKSNSAAAWFEAVAAVERERAEVPDHLKDPSRDGAATGHGKDYRYPHAFPGHWTAQQYLPDTLRDAVFYRPGSVGHEASIRDAVMARRDAQLAAFLSPDERDKGQGASAWNERMSAAPLLLELRDAAFGMAAPAATESVLVMGADDGLFLREAARRCPGGRVLGLVRDAQALERLTAMLADIEATSRPAVALMGDAGGDWDLVMADGCLSARSGGYDGEPLAMLSAAAGPSTRVVVCERVPAGRGVLPGLAAAGLDADTLEAFSSADAAFFEAGPGAANDEKALRATLASGGLDATKSATVSRTISRTLGPREADIWLADDSAYGSAVRAVLGDRADAVFQVLRRVFEAGEVAWPRAWTVVLAGRRP